MENKKALKVNCAVCDVRNITEDLLSAYDEVKINAASIITGPKAQALLGKYGVKINCARIQALEDNVRLSFFNGTSVISPSTAVPEEKTFLTLNGQLDIEPGSEEALKSYAGIVVNGSVICPKSIADLLGSKLTVSGAFNTYPDGCIRLKNTTILDRFFHLRAKQDAVTMPPSASSPFPPISTSPNWRRKTSALRRKSCWSPSPWRKPPCPLSAKRWTSLSFPMAAPMLTMTRS